MHWSASISPSAERRTRRPQSPIRALLARTANAEGFEQVAEQIVLSALDGAACELGASREEVVLAFSSRATLERFAQEHGDSPEELENLARAGLKRALDDAERANQLDPRLADLLRGLASRIPIAQLLDLLERLPRP